MLKVHKNFNSSKRHCQNFNCPCVCVCVSMGRGYLCQAPPLDLSNTLHHQHWDSGMTNRSRSFQQHLSRDEANGGQVLSQVGQLVQGSYLDQLSINSTCWGKRPVAELDGQLRTTLF